MEVLRIGNYLPNEFLADTNNYFYTIDSNHVKFNGEWECVRIPLSSFITNGKDWKIQRFSINLTSDKTQGEEVLIDEIRIRKAIN